MEKTIRVIVIILVTILVMTSCKDTFEVIIRNDTEKSYTIKSSSFDDVVLKRGEEKIFTLREVIIPFRINVIDTETKKSEWYIFRDVDHWFSVEHEVKIVITYDEIKIESNGSTRFEKE